MPNHCSNRVRIFGDPKTLLTIEKKMKGKNKNNYFDFEKLIPYPENFRVADEIADSWDKANPKDSMMKRPKDGYNYGGYEWCIKNWGTKWNAYNQEKTDFGLGYLEYNFTTAWGPPSPILNRLASKYKVLVQNLWIEEGSSEGIDTYGKEYKEVNK